MRTHGFVEISDKKYSFSYDGDVLHLIPDTGELALPLGNDYEFQYLCCTTAANESIVFLSCVLRYFSGGYVGKPGGLILGYSNIGLESFDAITFSGDLINGFYSPLNLIEGEQPKYDYNIGGGTITLKPFSETTHKEIITIKGYEAQLTVSVTQPGNLMRNSKNLGNLKSILRIEFKDKIDLQSFIPLYEHIRKLFSFLYFRQNIYFDDITLQTRTIDDKFQRIAKVTTRKLNGQVDLSNRRQIEYFFIKNHISNLLSIINNDQINLLFIPKDDISYSIIDINSFISCCASFESIFCFIHPNQKENNNEFYKQAKLDILNYLTDMDLKYKGKNKKLREAYKSFKRVIELSDFSLAEKISFAIEQYRPYLDSLMFKIPRIHHIEGKDVYLEKKEIITQIPNEVARMRNTIMHQRIIPFDNIHMIGYQVLQCLIYAMIMQNAGVDEQITRRAIDIYF